MVQVSIPFCLEIGAETETFQEQVVKKSGTEHCSTYLCRQGWTKGRRKGGVGDGAPDRMGDIEKGVSVQFSSSCILTIVV